MSGVFISFEGGEGSGKTTIASMIKEALTKEGYHVVLTREPGGVEIAEKIRDIIHDVKYTNMDRKTEALLYAASRRQHLVEKVIPALEKGYIVICDRYVDSSMVYQGIARGIGIDEVYQMNLFATENILPKRTIFFDILPEDGLQRVYANKDREVNRLDLENIDFHRKVYQGYLSLCDKFPNRIVKIDASLDIDHVYQQVLKYKEHNADNFIALNADSVLWVKSYENNQLIYKHTDQIKNMYADPLSRNTLNQMQTLSDAIKRDGSKIVSLTGILDQIDILSLTPGGDNISVTASADKTLPTIHEQQEEHFQNTTDFYLSIPRCNNDYIMVLYQSPRTQTKELQLIDWDGNGLCRYLLEEDLIDFCIDWNRKTIYGITDAEEVFKYDLALP